MPAGSAIGIHDDLAAGHSAIALGAAHHELAGGIDQKMAAVVQKFLRNGLPDHFLDDPVPDGVVGDIILMLGRHDHRIHPHRAPVPVFHGNLGFAVRAQERQDPFAAHLGKTLGQPVRKGYRHRHQFGGFPAGIAEHDALIARALLLEQAFPGGHALGNIRRLPPQRNKDRAAVAIKTHGAVVVSYIQNNATDQSGDINLGSRGHFAGDHRHLRRNQRLARHPRPGILGQYGIQNRVGNLIAHLVRMAFGH